MKTNPASDKDVLCDPGVTSCYNKGWLWLDGSAQIVTRYYACLGTSAMTTTVDHNQILALQALPDLHSFLEIITSYG